MSLANGADSGRVDDDTAVDVTEPLASFARMTGLSARSARWGGSEVGLGLTGVSEA
ncbi:hypothetical protein [Rubidibacter lacunae]|uniref:hypothetical protein n=1 Tax=Rubidibacter lacunae TaxID=582514 RepID=UPI0012ECA844|nr:hypothetical protein [Rubidibacter lacunae]